MKLDSTQREQVDAWFERWEAKKADVKELPEILGIARNGVSFRYDYESGGQFTFFPDDSDFDPDLIEAEISPKRYAKLFDGSPPNKKELKRWREKRIEDELQSEAGWWRYLIWRVEARGRAWFFRSLVGDGGYLDFFSGPYDSSSEALEDGVVGDWNERGSEADGVD
jgi:hypothetical protein